MAQDNQESQSTAGEGSAHKAEAAPPQLTKADVEAAAKGAVESALAAQKQEFDKKLGETETQYRTRLEHIAHAALGENKTTKGRDDVLREFLTDPTQMFDEAISISVEEAIKKIRDEDAVSRDFEAAVQEEFEARASKGLELTKTEKETIAAYYGSTDPSQPARARLKEAMKKYDDFMESVTGEDFEARVAKAASLPSNSASAQLGSNESTFDEKAELEKENEKAKAKYDRAMNISD